MMFPLKFIFKITRKPCVYIKRVAVLFVLVILPYFAVIHTGNIIGFWKSDSANMNSVGSNSCNAPKLELWPEPFREYFKKSGPIFCGKDENWVYIENGTYRFVPNIEKKVGKPLCEAITVVRGDDYAAINGERLKPLKDGDPIVSDFSEVRCVGQSGKVFKSLLSGITRRGNTTGRYVKKDNHHKENQMNILIFGFDSVSRMTWMRSLPATHKYFTETLGGVVLEGYNIVGDGTPQALLPILTGKNETELPESRRGSTNAKPVDGHPWIWKEMKDLGYVTQWGEDGAQFGTFTYRMLGFEQQPVDHYMRTFYLRAEAQYNQHPPYCLGSVPRHVNMLNWILELYKVYPSRPKFSFLFHSELSHDGFGELGAADLDLKAFLEYMEQSGHLDNTLLILMSDHGARYQKMRATTQGKYEERMPYFSFRFPKWFEKTYPHAMRNLRINSQRLTSPYDIHETLRHILNFNNLSRFDSVSNKTIRGRTLLEEVPSNRKCTEAGVAAHWCICMNWRAVSTANRFVYGAAKQLIASINAITEPHRRKCSMISLNKIVSAVLYSPSEEVLKFKKSQDFDGRNPEFTDTFAMSEQYYQVTIETSPGLAKFEATVKYSLLTKTFSVEKTEISRINKYGDQPICIQDQFPHLRSYCYCY